MSIGSVSPSSGATAQPLQPGPLKQARQDFGALYQALSSGNLDAAQSAFTHLQRDMQATQNGQSGGVQQQHHHHHHVADGTYNQTATAATGVNGASGGTINTTA